MKKFFFYIIAAVLLALGGCNDNTPAPSYAQPPVVNQQDTPSVAQAVPQQDTTFRDAALGAAGGYLLGRVLHGGEPVIILGIALPLLWCIIILLSLRRRLFRTTMYGRTI